ncbi:hypothetical protein GJAV_G00071590 [Gymnothorax javanicus]|nr:hypothetical protein GJAV_G00071590 [Gymnothorax javanicus]
MRIGRTGFCSDGTYYLSVLGGSTEDISSCLDMRGVSGNSIWRCGQGHNGDMELGGQSVKSMLRVLQLKER